MIYTFGLVLFAVMAIVIKYLWSKVSKELDDEMEDNKLLSKKKAFEDYVLPTKTEIKSIKDAQKLKEIESELDRKSQDFHILIQEIEERWKQNKSTLKLQNKQHRIDNLSRYVYDLWEKTEL